MIYIIRIFKVADSRSRVRVVTWPLAQLPDRCKTRKVDAVQLRFYLVGDLAQVVELGRELISDDRCYFTRQQCTGFVSTGGQMLVPVINPGG